MRIAFGGRAVASATTDSAGAFSATFAIPTKALPGHHRVSATGDQSGLTAYQAFLVRVDWSQFHFGPRHHGNNNYENVIGRANVRSLGVEWSFQTGSDFESTSPVVANGAVYVGTDQVYALDASTGALRWTSQHGERTPAVANRVVFDASSDGTISALRASTGERLWSFSTGGVWLSSPAVVNGIVYIGSTDNSIYALSAATGDLIWSFATGGWVQSSPAVAHGVVYFGSNDGHVYALNASTGAPIWSHLLGQGVLSSPTIAGRIVYVGSTEGWFWALNASTGAVVWRQFGGVSYTSPAVAHGLVYLGAWDGSGGEVSAYEASSGTLKWTFRTGVAVESSPAVANGVLYVGARDGTFYALGAATGKMLWSYTIGAYVDSSPAVANGIVYVGADDGKLYAFGPSGKVEP